MKSSGSGSGGIASIKTKADLAKEVSRLLPFSRCYSRALIAFS